MSTLSYLAKVPGRRVIPLHSPASSDVWPKEHDTQSVITCGAGAIAGGTDGKASPWLGKKLQTTFVIH